MFKKNTAVTGFTFGLVSAAGAAVTSGSTFGYVTLDGGSAVALGGTCVHEANGQWSVNIAAAEMNGDIVGLAFENSGAVTAYFTIRTVPADMADLAASLTTILARLPAALVGGRMDASVGAMASGVVTAAAINDGAFTSAKFFTVDGLGLQSAIQIMAATTAGKLSGSQTATEVFKGVDGTTTRVTVTADSSGNRTNVVYGV